MTLTHVTAYYRPTRIEEAVALLHAGSARLLAGGTDLVVRCPEDVTSLVDLAGLGLRYVTVEESGAVRIGAMSTFTDLLEHPAVAGHTTGVVGEMLVQVGSVLHRNSATIGGHVARSRLSDVLPVLLALDATVVSCGPAEAQRDLSDHLVADLGPHVVTELRLPPPAPGAAGAFVRFSRTSYDHALVNVCCRLDVEDGAVRAARVVVGESATVGRRLDAAEAALVDGPASSEAIDEAVAAVAEGLELHGDWLASAAYRRHLAEVGIRRCLTTVLERLPGGRP